MSRISKNLKIFVIYFNLHLTKKVRYKVFINGKNKPLALGAFFKKMGRDYKGFEHSNITIYQINPSRYKGQHLSDKQIDKLMHIQHSKNT